MGYSVQEIAEITQGKLIRRSAAQGIADRIEHLLTDSRRIVYPESSVFIAIRGERHDGHAYISDAYDAGVRTFLIEKNSLKSISVPLTNDVNLIVADHALRAMQMLCAHHRSQFTYPVIGITGSNGKTIVKEWLYQLLKDDLNIVRSPRSFNSQVGVPLSVWQMNSRHQLAIFEAGISKQDEMPFLQQIIRPGIGIFTNIGPAHDEGFHSLKEKLHEKLQLFRDSELLVYGADQPMVGEAIAQFSPRHPQLRSFSWSRTGNTADIQFEVEVKQSSTSIALRKGSQTLGVQIPFTDEASISNACSCFAFLVAINRLATDVLKRFADLQPVEMRLQQKEGVNNCVIINDSYNTDISSLHLALDFMEQQGGDRARTLILSDIPQTGMKERELYAEVAKLIRQKQVGKLIGIGPMLSKHRNLFDLHAEFYPDTASFTAAFRSLDYANHVVLLKGARHFRFERISSLLEKRVHETVLEINLNALVHNLNVYRSMLKPGVKMMGMVKAFSYGAGSYEIARVLEFHRVDYLTVAYADEGVTLREAGIKTPVMVMNPEVSGFEAILQHNLEPEVYNHFILAELIRACDGQEVGIHIELDCGMKRLGFEEHDLDALLQTLSKNPNIRVRSVFAHLAASEEKKHDEFTRDQIARFSRLAAMVCSAFPYPVMRHVLNSSGIVRFPEAQLDMVRLGIGLYGIDPSVKIQKQLQHIGTLKTVISQIREIRSHETVGYSRRGRVSHDARIATVAIGYADGFNRKLGNGKGHMLVNGQRAPIVGSVCMDMTMLDVTGIDCAEGDEVIVFGRDLSILDLADKIGTIPYEVLTSISQRVKRVYYWE